MRRSFPVVAGFGATLLFGCFGTADAYRCGNDGNCNGAFGGRCESSEFCSYPDPACPSGRRYDDLASDALDGKCVDEDVEPPGSTGTTDTGETTDTTDTTGPDPCPPVCNDLDGDGYGVGPGCAGLDCDDANPSRFEGCLYVAPNGDDANAGSDPGAPWGTLAHAVAQLVPGDSLVLLPGDYDASSTGLLAVTCGGDGPPNGTASAPISIRGGRNPDEERQAILSSGGSTQAIRLTECSYWNLTGLTARGGDFQDGSQSLVQISGGSNLKARRMLVTTSNAWTNSTAMIVGGAADVLVEDTEVYDFHITGLSVYQSERVTMRRVYVNSRSRADLAGADAEPTTPTPSVYTDAGDNGIRVSGTGHRIENCIFHGPMGRGVLPEGDVVVDGSVSVDAYSGVLALSGDLTIRNLVVLRSVNHGIDLRTPVATVIDAVTLIGSTLDGVIGTEGTPCVDQGGCSLAVQNALALGGQQFGVRAIDPIVWSVEASNANGNATDYGIEEPIDDAEGVIQGSFSEPVPEVGVGMGQCVVFIPEASAMKGRGKDGADIGANVLYRLVDGVTTQEPLWDPETGAFPCGATIAGINDVPGDSCFDMHTQLNVGTNGCDLPYAPSACDP